MPTNIFILFYCLGLLEVPQTKNDNTPEFDSEIESCVNRKNLLPSALNTSINITRISNHIQIVVDYDGKHDYYEINYNGLTCYTVQGLTEPINRNAVEAVQQCEKLVELFPVNKLFSCYTNFQVVA